MIKAPKNIPTRPTTDFAKESLFNILGNYFDFEQIDVLDLFCGTGNIGYEFASRGAKRIVSVDANVNCVNFVKKTIGELNCRAMQVIKNDVFKFISFHQSKYDIIFADPPYDLKHTREIPQLVFEKGLLKEGGWLIVEHSKQTDLSDMENFMEKRKYGNVNFSVFNL